MAALVSRPSSLRPAPPAAPSFGFQPCGNLRCNHVPFALVGWSLRASSPVHLGRCVSGCERALRGIGPRSLKPRRDWASIRVSATNEEAEGFDATAERSDLAREELVLFFFLLDVNTRLQRALNLEQYEAAQIIRDKIAEVESAMARLQELKKRVDGQSAKDMAQDTALKLLTLKGELQRAIDEERYSDAAYNRDKLTKLEGETLAASAAALAMESVSYKLRLGQRVRHSIFGYRGVIAGMDAVCCETEEWMDEAKIRQCERGASQPFYQVLVDVGERPGMVVAYVAEERLVAVEALESEKGVVEVLGEFEHPYSYLLFYGVDAAGDFIPSRQLREKFNAPRHEIPYDGEGDNNESGSSGPD